MSELTDQLRYRPVATTAAQMREAADHIESLEKVLATRERQIRAFTSWLDANQSDVWSRGLWDAHRAAIESPDQTTGSNDA